MSKHDIELLERVKVLERDWSENPRWQGIKRESFRKRLE